MNVFRLALKVAARHWQYLLIYLVAFGGMALVGSGAVQVAASDEFHEDMPKVAVIDRDGSALSSALADFALRDSVAVEVEDSTFGLQDAAAKDLASYVLIIPEGFERDIVAAAREGGEPPVLDTVISYQSARGSLANQRVESYAQALYGFAVTDPAADVQEIADAADQACEGETPVDFVPVQSKGIPGSYLNFAAFSSYGLFAAVAIFIAVGLASLKDSEIRRRLAAGPVPSSRYGVQVFAACATFSLFIWAILAGLGLLAINPLAEEASVEGVAVVLAAQLSFALLGCAAGFLLWQIGVSETMANGVGNIAGLICSFFSGAWIPLSIMGEGVREAAAFTPFYWATDAMTLIAEAPSITWGIMGQAAGEVGVTLLWAVVVAALAVALGRIRLRESGE